MRTGFPHSGVAATLLGAVCFCPFVAFVYGTFAMMWTISVWNRSKGVGSSIGA